jgi:hypothetical protein
MNRTPYELALESRVEGGPSEYRFHTADGVASKQSFRTAELLCSRRSGTPIRADCSVPKRTTASSEPSSRRSPMPWR